MQFGVNKHLYFLNFLCNFVAFDIFTCAHLDQIALPIKLLLVLIFISLVYLFHPCPSITVSNILIHIDLAKPKSGTLIFFFLHVSRAECLAPARTRTQVIRIGAQCTDHWTTGQSRGIGVPAVHLTMHVKSSTLYGHTVVQLYNQIFSA